MKSNKPFVYFGRLAHSKGVHTLIKSFYVWSKRSNNNVPLWIIGGSLEEINQIRNTVLNESNYLEKRNLLLWWGQMPHEVLPHLLKRCYTFCFPSMYEPGGRTILEAMGIGLPVIATKNGFAPEVIIDKVNGVIISEGSVEEWVEAMDLVYNDQTLAKKMGKLNRKKIEETYSIQAFQEKHMECYLSLQPKI